MTAAPTTPPARQQQDVGAHRRRRYVDALDRPLSGTVTLQLYDTPTPGTRASLTLPSVIEVALVDGWLDVHLPPGRYAAVADLTTADGHPVRPSPEVLTVT